MRCTRIWPAVNAMVIGLLGDRKSITMAIRQRNPQRETVRNGRTQDNNALNRRQLSHRVNRFGVFIWFFFSFFEQVLHRDHGCLRFCLGDRKQLLG